MAKRRKLIVGNWKMNGRLTSGLNLAQGLVDKAAEMGPQPVDVVVCPPFTLIWPVAEALLGTPILVGGQDCHYANHGAYTGDISSGMLSDLGARYVILGHSERRSYYKETSETVSQKASAAQLAGLTTIICVGETLEQKASNQTADAITKQLKASLPQKNIANHMVIAYEPVWAIGTGDVPEVEYIAEVHRVIRKELGSMGQSTRILYGGSVTADNAAEILGCEDVDGALVGGASLIIDGFWGIVEAAAAI